MAFIEMFHGDCRDILPAIADRHIDTIITDPVWPNCPDGRVPGADGEQEGLLKDALRIVPDARRIVIILRADSDPRFLQAVPSRWPFCRVQMLPYAVPGWLGRNLGGMEMAYCFGEPLPSRPGQRVIPGIAPYAQKTPPNGHPMPRSLIHVEWLVRWWSEPGDTILDPFMGSGTTAVAAYRLGRRFIGIEIDADYYAIAQQRVCEAQMQPALLQEI